MKVYADNAATTKIRKDVIDSMLLYMEKVYGNPSSLHDMGREADEAITKARYKIAKMLGCDANEIIFTSGGSESNNQAIFSAAYTGQKNKKKHIISTTFEHPSVLNTLKKLEKEAFEITLLDVHENGIVTPNQVKRAIRADTCLVTIMYANNEIGTIQPIKDIGEICQQRDVLFHTDAVQAVGHLHIDVHDQNIDMLSLSAHKFHGPKGVGVLYARNGIQVSSIIEGGAQEHGKRGGTENVPAIVGMSVALEEACKRIDENVLRLATLQSKLIQGLSIIPHSILNGDSIRRLPSNVNFCFDGIDSEALILLLNDKGVYASSGSACASGSLEPSHVLKAIGRSCEAARSSLRLSLSEYNTEEEIKYIIDMVTDSVAYLRSMSPSNF